MILLFCFLRIFFKMFFCFKEIVISRTFVAKRNLNELFVVFASQKRRNSISNHNNENNLKNRKCIIIFYLKKNKRKLELQNGEKEVILISFSWQLPFRKKYNSRQQQWQINIFAFLAVFYFSKRCKSFTFVF